MRWEEGKRKGRDIRERAGGGRKRVGRIGKKEETAKVGGGEKGKRKERR